MYRMSESKESEWVIVFNATSAIFQRYHGENKLIFNEMMMRSVLYKSNMFSFFFYSASSLKQQYADRHVAPPGHIILIPNQPVFALSP